MKSFFTVSPELRWARIRATLLPITLYVAEKKSPGYARSTIEIRRQRTRFQGVSEHQLPRYRSLQAVVCDRIWGDWSGGPTILNNEV